MKCYAIVGAKKHGKTTSAKALVQRLRQRAPELRVLVFDKNNEWNTGKPLPTMDAFLATVRTSRDALAVFEDAGIFFSNRGRSEALEDILTQARHTRVSVVMLFHSLRALPEYVVNQLDGIILHKTRDVPGTVERKFGDWPAIFDAYQTVQADPNVHAHVFVQL